MTSPPARAVFRNAFYQPPLVLTYHRFAGDANGHRGMPVTMLRRQLEVLTREGFTVVALSDLVDAIAEHRELPARTMVLTVDDGYEDFASTGAPLFLEFGVPVTVFLTTGFVDREMWMWWDQLDAATSTRPGQVIDVAGKSFPLRWTTEPERRITVHGLAQELERMRTAEREAVLGSIFGQLNWTSPVVAPREFAPMSWEQVRALAGAGIQFGAHTVTHPILALCDDRQAQQEIEQSHARLVTELRRPLPVLAYPNGDTFARGTREVAYARSAGLVAAVTMSPQFVTSQTVAEDLYSIPRVAVPDDFASFLQLVAGPESLRQRIRAWS